MPVHGIIAVARSRTLRRAIALLATVLAMVFITTTCALLAVLLEAPDSSSAGCIPAPAAGAPSTVGPAASIPDNLSARDANGRLTTLSRKQLAVASAYIGVGSSLGISVEGQQIAIMMSLQESMLRILANPAVPESLNHPHEGLGFDHDSVGTAQQRPSAGWGTPAELMDPVYNARAFFGGPSGPNHGSPRGLLDIRGWASMSKGQAAQAVQVSAFPELYAKWEPVAIAVVNALQAGAAVPACIDEGPDDGQQQVPQDLSEKRKEIIKFAQQGVGGAYVWGGTAYKAWDCSGYVKWVFAQVGITLPRVSQWTAGTPTNDPQPGDLVAQNPDGPNHWGHVGIYAGNGMMYSALNPSMGTLLHSVSRNQGAAYFILEPAER